MKLSKDADPIFAMNSSQVACITIPLTQPQFEDLHGDALHEFYINCLTRGVDQFLVDFPEPLAAIHEAIDIFRTGGYRNQWIEKKKLIREFGFSAVLSCQITIDRFALQLTLLRGGKTIYDQEIFVSDPDEIAFAHRFKDVVAVQGKIVVIDRFKNPLLILSAEDIEANIEPNNSRHSTGISTSIS